MTQTANQLWYYRALVSAFRETTTSPLVDELDRVVTELEQARQTAVEAAPEALVQAHSRARCLRASRSLADKLYNARAILLD